jgi:hypothetical protein
MGNKVIVIYLAGNYGKTQEKMGALETNADTNCYMWPVPRTVR